MLGWTYRVLLSSDFPSTLSMLGSFIAQDSQDLGTEHASGRYHEIEMALS